MMMAVVLMIAYPYIIELCFVMIFISSFLFFFFFSSFFPWWQLPTFNELSESTDARSLTFAIKEQEANLEALENENGGQ